MEKFSKPFQRTGLQRLAGMTFANSCSCTTCAAVAGMFAALYDVTRR